MFKKKRCKQCGWDLKPFTKEYFCSDNCVQIYDANNEGPVELRKSPFIVRSEIQGSEGKIVTYDFELFGKKCYISISETKWHLDHKYNRRPIWWANDDGFPSLYIWNVAFYYDNRPEQTTFCYCPACHKELISSGSFIEDTELVKYQCVDCGTVSSWLFDAPVPLLLYVNGKPHNPAQPRRSIHDNMTYMASIGMSPNDLMEYERLCNDIEDATKER